MKDYRHLGELFHALAGHKESKILEGHIMGDHIHMYISIPPKYAVSNVVGYLKGKSDPDRAEVRRSQPQFQRREFLGAGIFCRKPRMSVTSK